MKGIILLQDNYSYEGDIQDDLPHGHGVFNYSNGDIYIGKCLYGKPDGYGKYIYKNGATYTGFFSYGKNNGVGTFEDKKNIYKGNWRFDKKHGMFYKTNKLTMISNYQKWLKNRLVENRNIPYVEPKYLQTTKKHPRKTPALRKLTYKGTGKKCMVCIENPVDATNTSCGHIVLCYQCFSKCDRCPICRIPIEKIIKLYIC
jgi:hypothetical protein